MVDYETLKSKLQIYYDNNIITDEICKTENLYVCEYGGRNFLCFPYKLFRDYPLGLLVTKEYIEQIIDNPHIFEDQYNKLNFHLAESIHEKFKSCML